MNSPRMSIADPPRRAARLLAISLLSLCSLPAWPRKIDSPSSQTREQVVAQARRRIEATDFSVSGRLSQVTAGGARTNFHYTMKAHWFPEGLKVLFEISDPASARQRILVRMDARGQLSIARGAGKDGPLRPVAADRMGDGIAGTLFTYEDLVEDQFFWSRQTLLPDTTYGARHCRLLESEPPSPQFSQYASVRSWIDISTGVPVYVEKSVRASGAKRDFVSFDLRREGSTWSPSQVQITQTGSHSTTVLVIERGTPLAKLTRKDFELRP